MKKIFVALLATVALAPLSPASAADIEATAAYDWTGFYLGVHGGYGWGTSETNDIFAYDLDPEGWFGGGQAGYNYQLPNNIVLGVEADASFGNLKDDSLVLTDMIIGPDIPTEAEVEVTSFGTARLRAGYAFDRVMPYVTGGLGWARQTVDYFQDYLPNQPGRFVNNLEDTKTYFGWTVGAGIEAALTDNFTAKIEYLYSDLGSKEYEGNAFGIEYPADIDLEIQTVRLGLNYKFN
jgi:outer membrane immunogenic protein